MAFEDIERLKEKIDKDPNSKLFILLAEEYKKAGMYDEAIDVLIKGIERQPGYMSARVSLGKIYIERDMLKEAKTEFEQVVSAIPDNLYAHKKLAEIYRDIGEKDRAVREFKTVLQLNPIDEWAATNLADIEGEHKPQHEVQEIEKVEEKSHIQKEPIIEIKEEEILTESEAIAEVKEEKSFEVPPSEGVIEETPSETIEKVEESVAEAFAEAEGLTEDELLFESVPIESDVAVQPALNISDADPYILQDKYMEAMNIYRKLLSIEPDNMQVMQRIEELKTLLRLLGKDKGELIAKLDNLLAGIKKRRDEFLESS
jgi:tetratricopeptide (TPR) repeat protein